MERADRGVLENVARIFCAKLFNGFASPVAGYLMTVLEPVNRLSISIAVTLLACIRTGRHGVAVDKDEKIVADAENRLRIYYSTLVQLGLLHSRFAADYSKRSIFKPTDEERKRE